MKVKCLPFRNTMPRISEIWLKTLTAVTLQALSYGRECYNYKEHPTVRSCDHGCCGDDYEEYCCDATLQIVGCVIGGVVLISIIAGIAFYCWRQKSKRRLAGQGGGGAGAGGGGGGLLARFGMRSNNNNQTNNVQRQPIPVIPTRDHHRMAAPGGPNMVGPHMRHAQFNPQYIQGIQLAGPPPANYLYPGSTMYAGQTLAPTAPMPPPYSMPTMAPPPYMPPNKPVPPPPEYNSVVNHGYKASDDINRMPPPSS